MSLNKDALLNMILAKSVPGIERWLLPFLFASFAASGTSLLPVVFNPTTRWGFLLFGFVWMLMNVRKFRVIRSAAVFKLLLVLVVWCFLTSFWSEIFLLSFYKSLAFAMTVFTMFMLGASWGSKVAVREVLNCFGLLFIVVILISTMGSQSTGLDGSVQMFTGLAGNPNNMGFLLASALPFGFWQLYTAESARNRWLWALLDGFVVYHLITSHSRASMILTAFVVAGFFLGVGLKKYFLYIVIAVFAAGAVLSANPDLIDVIYAQYVLKGSDESVAFENSRGWVYRISYDAALQGGVTGVGNGISVGADPAGYAGGFTSVGYGREKSSSVLAIVEETGLIGLLLATSYIVTLFFTVFKLRKYLKTRSPFRVVFFMVGGLFLGLVVYSNFEAWWVAPGSNESVFFWGVSGVFFGMALQIRAARMQAMKTLRK